MPAIMADPYGERFQMLRTRLQDLRYHQPIDVASAPLIEALLADLCSTNDQLSGIRAQGDGQSQELVETQSQMHPLRKENSRLLRENNQLHLELITSAEEAARAHKEVTEASRRVEKQNTDLRFAVAQQTERVRRAEEENAGLRARFDASLEQTGKVLPSGHEVKSGRARREHMEAHSPVAPLSLPPSAGVGLLKGSPGVVTDPLDADDDNAELLRLSEAQMNALQQRLAAAEEELQDERDARDEARAQVAAREAEVARLAKLLEAGRDFKSLSLQQVNESNQAAVAQLNGQVRAPPVGSVAIVSRAQLVGRPPQLPRCTRAAPRG